ncbi:MAG TPA: polysaccharide deacetylase family protein, partial [Acidimicrobiales bacterium]|nr:polysaccharide deacetylase family protein [Acidimicrobiales bacterium]
MLVPALTAGAAPRADARGATLVHETPLAPAGAGEMVVALTFDDGPHPRYTPAILDVLARYGVQATFFALGREAERHPDLVQRIVAEGHAIANHTWDHPDLRTLDEQQFAHQVDHTNDVLHSISGHRPICARPPYGRSDPNVTSRLAARGLTNVVWSIDSRDFAKPGAGAIVDSALDGLHPGAIILLHDGGGNRDQTIEALPTIIERIQAAGHRIAPICRADPNAPAPPPPAPVAPEPIAPPAPVEDPDPHPPAGAMTVAEGLQHG